MYHWGSSIDMPMNTFVASQIFVYYVNGGILNSLTERVVIPFGVSQMIRYDLRIIEKIGLLIFLKINCVSGFLRKLYLSNTTFPITAPSSSMNTGMLLTGSMTVSWNGTLKEGLISWQLNIWDSVPLTALWWYWTASRMPPTMRSWK